MGTNGRSFRPYSSARALRAWYDWVLAPQPSNEAELAVTFSRDPKTPVEARARPLPGMDLIILTWERDETGVWVRRHSLGWSNALTYAGRRGFAKEVLAGAYGVSEADLREWDILDDGEQPDDELRFAYAVELEQDGAYLIRPEDEEAARSVILPNGPPTGPYAALFPFRDGRGIIATRDLPRGADGMPELHYANFAPYLWEGPGFLILDSKKEFGWYGDGDRRSGRADDWEYVSPQYALTNRFKTDAHTVAYVYRCLPKRINEEGRASLDPYSQPVMTWFIIDVDGKEDGQKRASAEWRAGEEKKIARLLEVHPGAFRYDTRGGYRLIYRLAYPRRPKGPNGEPTWSRFYSTCLAYLNEAFGIKADDACKDWTRLYRLPFVMRDGELQLPLTTGDPTNIGYWTFDPDVSVAAPKQPTLKRPPSVSSKRKPVGNFATELPVEWLRFIKPLAAAFGKTKKNINWHELHLWLAKALRDRGVPPEIIPELQYQIALAAGDCIAEKRRKTAINTIRAEDEGKVVKGYSGLKEQYPPVAKALDKLFPWKGRAGGRLQWQLDNAPVPETMLEADEASREVASAIRRQVKVTEATTGVGKTTAAARVARERVETCRTDEDGRWINRTGFVAPTHEVAERFAEAVGMKEVRYLKGIGAFKDADRKLLCEYRSVVEPLLSTGLDVRATICNGFEADPCPYRDDCPAYNGAIGEKNAPVIVSVHQLAPIVADEIAGPGGLLIIDETPAMKENLRFTEGEVSRTIQVLEDRHAFGQDVSAAFLPAVKAIRDGRALTEEEIQEIETALPNDGTLPPPMIREIGRLRSGTSDPKDIATALRIMAATIAVARGTHEGTFVEGIRGMNPDYAATLRAEGSILLDATPDFVLLNHILGHKPEVVKIHATDGTTITRRVINTTDATRKNWAPKGGKVNVKGVERVLKVLFDRAWEWQREVNPGGEGIDVGIVTFQAVATLLDKAWRTGEGAFSEVLNEFKARDGKLRVMYYGYIEGRNTMEGVDVLATLGDQRLPLDDEQWWARTRFGMNEEEADAYYLRLSQLDLEQAHGRDRSPRRTKPGLLLHFGQVLPRGWHRQNCKLGEMPTGAPKRDKAAALRQAPMTGEEVTALRKGAGLTQKDLADLLEVNVKTIGRIERDERVLTVEMAEKLRDACDRTDKSL
jgi:DNA-binding transcriptional regulator YiaG